MEICTNNSKNKNMKRVFRNSVVVFMVVFMITSCAKKNGTETSYSDTHLESIESEAAVDSTTAPMSMAASQEVEGKKFVRKANVDMDVSDVYQATIYIENTLKEMGGFVTSSNYRSDVLEENIFPQSEEKSLYVRKYTTKNQMQVRVPTEKLSDFLKSLNDKSIFLRERTITAQDVSANVKMAELEKQRMEKHKAQLSQQTNTTKNAEATNDNERELNYQKINNFNLADELKYSTVSKVFTVEIFTCATNTSLNDVLKPTSRSTSDTDKKPVYCACLLCTTWVLSIMPTMMPMMMYTNEVTPFLPACIMFALWAAKNAEISLPILMPSGRYLSAP